MKKAYIFPIAFALLAMILSTGCEELHQMAEVSLDQNKINYKGPSPYPKPLGTPAENLYYLFLEDLWLDFFPPLDWMFDNSGQNTVYDRANYDPGNALFLPGNLRNPSSTQNSKSKMGLLLSEGLSYVGKGGKENDVNAKTVTRLNYLELPVFLNLYARMGKSQNALHVGAGPWIAYALNGKFKTTGQNTVAVKFGKNGDFTRMDYGIGFNGGVLFSKKWNVTLGYDMGLNNLIGTPGAPNDGDKAHTQNFSLSIGYWIR